MDIITKTTPIGETEKILELHDIKRPMFWEIAIGMLLGDCDHLEVHGYGPKAYFVKCEEAAT